MRYNDLLLELFDTDVAWRFKKVNDKTFKFNTNIGGRDVELEYISTSGSDFDSVHVGFTVDGEYDITGRGDAPKIFGAVINHMRLFIDRVNPYRIGFTAHKPSDVGDDGNSQYTTRSDLYKRMVRKFAANSDYNYHTEDRDHFEIFVLTRKNNSNEI